MSENLELPPPERHHVHRRHSRIPADTVIWALLFGMAIPAAIYAGWFRPTVHSQIAGDAVLQWLGLAFGTTGTFILAVVRYPLYIRRYHHGFKPRDLPHHYRPAFWVSYILICVGVLVYLTLIIKQNLT